MTTFAATLWRLALAALLAVLTYFAWQFDAPAWADRQAELTRTEARQAIFENLKPVLPEVRAWRKDTMRQLDELQDTVADIARKADAQLSRTNDTVSGLRDALQPSLAHVEAITAHADEASAILLARNALPAQLLGVTAAAKVTLGETAQTMRTIRDTTAVEGPATAKAVRVAAEQAGGIATDIHTFTTEATKPVPWYRKVGNILYSGARLGAAIF